MMMYRRQPPQQCPTFPLRQGRSRRYDAVQFSVLVGDVPSHRWLSHVRDTVQEEWPYLSLLPQQRGIQPCKTVGGVNTVVPIVVRVPRRCDGPEGDPEVALGYEVSYNEFGVGSDKLTSSKARFDTGYAAGVADSRQRLISVTHGKAANAHHAQG